MFDTIYLDNDYRAAYTITAPDDTSPQAEGSEEPAILLVINVRLSATEGGAAIDASLNRSAPELPGKPGTYTCIFEGDDLRTHLASVSRVWVVVAAGVGDILCSNRVSVKATRRAE